LDNVQRRSAGRRQRPRHPPQAVGPHPPLSCTPAHLAEKILHSKTALEGERKLVAEHRLLIAVQQANARGGRDNSTIIILRYENAAE
jgi:hypothetical protein